MEPKQSTQIRSRPKPCTQGATNEGATPERQGSSKRTKKNQDAKMTDMEVGEQQEEEEEEDDNDDGHDSDDDEDDHNYIDHDDDDGLPLDVMNKAKEWLSKNKPVMTMDRLRDLLPSAEDSYDDIWGEKEEEMLLASFPEDDAYRVYVLTSEYDMTPEFLSMWRRTCRLRGCFPEQIIGAKSYLEYGVQVEVEPGVWKPDPNWNRDFCNALEVLVISSPCEGNMRLLGLFIRYTVACYTDRRMVSVDDSWTGQTFFDDLGDLIRLHNGAKPLKDIGHDARQNWINKGLYLPWEAYALEQIELLASEEPAEPAEPAESAELPVDEYGNEVQIYHVLTSDLEILLRAFIKVKLKFPHFVSWMNKDRQRIIQDATSVGGAPSNIKELGELRVPLVLDDMRIRAKRQLQTPPRNDDEDNPVGNKERHPTPVASVDDSLGSIPSHQDEALKSRSGSRPYRSTWEDSGDDELEKYNFPPIKLLRGIPGPSGSTKVPKSYNVEEEEETIVILDSSRYHAGMCRHEDYTSRCYNLNSGPRSMD